MEIASKYEKNCKDCPVGFYSDTIGAITYETCIKCSPGTFNDYPGGDDINNCKKCITGMFSGEGALNCSLCEGGKYSSIMGGKNCLDCPSGKYSNISGTILCEECAPNTEQNTDKTKCECSSGFYYDIKNDINLCLMK